MTDEDTINTRQRAARNNHPVTLLKVLTRFQQVPILECTPDRLDLTVVYRGRDASSTDDFPNSGYDKKRKAIA
jgi:hypothetical protein